MKTIRSVYQTALRGWNHSACLFNFGLRSRIKNISKIKQSNLFEHLLYCFKNSFTVSEIVYMRNFLSMNLNLKRTVERSKRRSSYFLSVVFITKCFT